MAIYHCSIKSISRGKGHSATAAAAYRAGIRIEDATTGLIHDYTKKGGVRSVDMLTPKDAPAWASDPSTLWNAAEAAETRKNARVAREMIVALPCELSDEQRQTLACAIGQMLVDRYQVAVQVAVHAPDAEGDNRNHHAHVLFTSRQIGTEGFGSYAAKVLDEFKAGPVEISDLRAQVATITNAHLGLAGQGVRVDHRTLAEQARDAAERGNLNEARQLDRLPTVKEGRAPGQRQARQAINSRIRQSNAASQRKWDRWEKEARSEGRLMPPATDQRDNHRSQHDTTRTRDSGHTDRARTRARSAGASLTDDSIDTQRLRVDASGVKPVLSVRASDGFAVIQPRWSAERGRRALQRDEQGHSGRSAPLHFPPANPLGSVSGRQPVSPSISRAGPQATRSLTGKAAQDAVRSAGQSVLGVALSDADEYTRKAVRMTEERLSMQERARAAGARQAAETERLLQADADFRLRMARMAGDTAIRWREEDRRAQDAQKWLDAQRDEEQRRFQHREHCKTKRNSEHGRYLEWKRRHPEPPARLWNRHQRAAWEQECGKARAPLEAAHHAYQHAKVRADTPALMALEQERRQRERERDRAVAARQALGPLPSEEHAQNEMQRLTFEARPESYSVEPPDIPDSSQRKQGTPLTRGFQPPRR